MGLRVPRNWIWAVTTHKMDIKAFSHKTLRVGVPHMSSSCFAKILRGDVWHGVPSQLFQVDKGFSKVWYWGHINITTLVEGSSKKVKVGEKRIEGSGSWPPLKQHRLFIEATLSFTAKSPHHCHFFLHHPIPASETLDTYWLLSNVQMLTLRVVDNMGSVNGDYSGLDIYLRGYSNMGGQIALQFLWNTSGKLLHPPFNCIDLVTVSLVWGISERCCKKS